MKDTNNYWIIPMNFNNCNYKQLKEEWNKNKKIMWQVCGKPDYKKTRGYEVPKKNKARSIKKGDVIYFYITNLPSESKSSLSRIMLRGIVEDEPSIMEKQDVYMRNNDTDMIIGFSIGSITTLGREKLVNNELFSWSYLKENYDNFHHPQGKCWLSSNKNTISKDLIVKLEECFKSNLGKDDFNTLIDYFDKKCFFSKKFPNKSAHKTFTARNGLDYYEYHHFMQRKEEKKNSKLRDIIYAPENGLFLCSNCHNRLHYGQPEEIKKMLEIVLEDEKIQKLLEENNFQQILNEDESIEDKDILKWFQKSYNV